MAGWVVSLIISIVLSMVSYLLAPKPKGAQKPKAQEITSPTVDAGRSIPVVFGRVRVRSPNLLWMGGNRSQEIKK